MAQEAGKVVLLQLPEMLVDEKSQIGLAVAVFRRDRHGAAE
jgi:hypothetical protein